MGKNSAKKPAPGMANERLHYTRQIDTTPFDGAQDQEAEDSFNMNYDAPEGYQYPEYTYYLSELRGDNIARKTHTGQDVAITRLVFFTNRDPLHNFSRFHVQTRYTLNVIEIKELNKLPISDLEVLFVRACQEAAFRPGDFTHRLRYIDYWRLTPESHYSLMNLDLLVFARKLKVARAELVKIRNNVTDDFERRDTHLLESIHGQVSLLEAFLGRYSCLVNEMTIPGSPLSFVGLADALSHDLKDNVFMNFLNLHAIDASRADNKIRSAEVMMMDVPWQRPGDVHMDSFGATGFSWKDRQQAKHTGYTTLSHLYLENPSAAKNKHDNSIEFDWECNDNKAEEERLARNDPVHGLAHQYGYADSKNAKGKISKSTRESEDRKGARVGSDSGYSSEEKYYGNNRKFTETDGARPPGRGKPNHTKHGKESEFTNNDRDSGSGKHSRGDFHERGKGPSGNRATYNKKRYNRKDGNKNDRSNKGGGNKR